MSDNSEVVATSYNAPQLRNIAADKSKSSRKQGTAAMRKFNEYILLLIMNMYTYLTILTLRL